MRQPISVDDIGRASFSTTRRGYSPEEVDAYLRGLAESIRWMLKDASENAYRNLGDEMGGLLQRARDSADEMLTQAQSDAATVRGDAEADASRRRKEAEDDAARIRHEAEESATQTRSDADRVAGDTRAEADRDAKQRIQEADDRVRLLEGIEADIRERLRGLAAELDDVTRRLHDLETTDGEGLARAAATGDSDDEASSQGVLTGASSEVIELNRTGDKQTS